MAHFASEAELEAFLGELNPTYGQYATALWSNGITTQRQLANADKEDLLAAGVTSAIHAKDIKATAGAQGRNSTEDEAGPSKKPRAGLSSQDVRAITQEFNASGAGSFTMLEVADRLGLNVERAKSVPCCLELQESIPTPPPYTWHHHEAHVEEVCKGQIWLQDVVCTGDMKAIAVTSQTWLRAVWTEEEIEISNSKADYIFADAGAAEKLPEPPAQPSEAQLLELLKDIKGVYEAKPSRHVQEKGILSLWSQMFAEFLAITWMLDHEAGVKKSLPVFGGDFNHHMIMHQPSSHVLHFMKHDPDDAGKRCAVACMRHLLKQDNVLLLETGDDVEMDVDPLQMARPKSSDAAVDTRGGHACTSTDEHSGTVHMSDDVQGEQCSFNLQRMDAVFHEVVMRRLRSPMGYESLGKNKPPLQVEHSSFSDYVKSLKIVGLAYT